MISWVRDLAYKLGFVVVIAKSDNGGNSRKRFVTLRCQRGGEYRKYVHNEIEDMATLIVFWKKYRSHFDLEEKIKLGN
jgi:hypothetical protein